MLFYWDAHGVANGSSTGKVASNGAGKNAAITWTLAPSQQAVVLFDFILDMIFPAGRAHLGDANQVNAEANKNFNDASGGLGQWVRNLLSTPKGLVSAASHSAVQLEILLDRASIGTTPFTFPVSANTSHMLQLLNGKALALQRSIQLRNGELLEVVVP